MKGKITKTIQGQNVDFYFGMYAFNLFMEKMDIDNIAEIETVIAKNPFKSMPLLLFCAAKAACLLNEKDIYFNEFKATVWVDNLTKEDLNEVMKTMISSFVKSANQEDDTKKKVTTKEKK